MEDEKVRKSDKENKKSELEEGGGEEEKMQEEKGGGGEGAAARCCDLRNSWRKHVLLVVAVPPSNPRYTTT